MKRFLKTTMVVILLAVVSMAYTKGASEPTESKAPASQAKAKPYKIAVGLGDSGATMFSIMSNNVREFAKMSGGEVFFQSGVAISADNTVSFVENQIAAGVSGILICPPNDTVLATVKTLCEQAKVYWGICFRSILDEQIRTMVEASPYYIGRCFENEQEAGYRLMKQLGSKGIKKVAIIAMPKGNTTSDMREKGVAQACAELGMKVVAEARGLAQASDVTAAAQSFLTAYKDLDCILTLSTTAAGSQNAVVKAIQEAGRVGKVYAAAVDFPDKMDSLFESGVLAAASGLAHWGYDPYISFVLIANACMGTPINTAADKKAAISMPMYTISDAEAAKTWIAKFGDPKTLYYTQEEMKSLVKGQNATLTLEALQKKVDAFTTSIAQK